MFGTIAGAAGISTGPSGIPSSAGESNAPPAQSGSRHPNISHPGSAFAGTVAPIIAVDIGPSYAATWLSTRGAEYGLCQIYGNEPWHYELRPEAVDEGCPPLYADPTQDPRMQQ